MNDDAMTKTERRELAKLARKRAKVLKAKIKERRAEVLADFEAQLAKMYTPDDDAAMRRLYDDAEEAVAEASERLRDRCDELGIPPRFAPRIRLAWFDRGANALKERRAELRKVVKSRLDHLEKEARTEIDRQCLETEEKLISGGITSEAGRQFLEQMPTLDELLPKFDVSEIADVLPRHARDGDELEPERAALKLASGKGEDAS